MGEWSLFSAFGASALKCCVTQPCDTHSPAPRRRDNDRWTAVASQERNRCIHGDRGTVCCLQHPLKVSSGTGLTGGLFLTCYYSTLQPQKYWGGGQCEPECTKITYITQKYVCHLPVCTSTVSILISMYSVCVCHDHLSPAFCISIAVLMLLTLTPPPPPGPDVNRTPNKHQQADLPVHKATPPRASIIPPLPSR